MQNQSSFSAKLILKKMQADIGVCRYMHSGIKAIQKADDQVVCLKKGLREGVFKFTKISVDEYDDTCKSRIGRHFQMK
eukprot:UN24473